MADWFEYVKIAIGLVSYLMVAPVLGFLIKDFRPGQIAVFFAMIAGTAFHADQITLTVFSVNHTGHTRGFEISLMVFAAITLLAATFFGRRRDLPLMPPGFFFYGAFCLAGAFTLVLTLPIPWPGALVDLEGDGDWISARNIWEAILKFSLLSLVFLATHAFIRSKQDILWFARSLAVALIIAGTYALFDRYVEGAHRVRATFDHSNAFGIWAYMGAIPCLVLSFHRKIPLLTALLLFGGYCFGAVSAILTVSRGSLMIVAVLSVVVALLSIARKRTRRSYFMGLLFLIVGGYGTYASIDTISERVSVMRNAASVDKEIDAEDLRVVLARQASFMLRDSVFGVGWNNYQIACSLPVTRYVEVLIEHEAADGDNHSEEIFYRAPVVESLYWYLLAETGYLGFACFLFFILTTLWLTLKHCYCYRNTWVGDFLVAILLVLSALYLHSFIEKVLLQTKNAVLWLAMLAVASKLETIRRQKRREPIHGRETSGTLASPASS